MSQVSRPDIPDSQYVDLVQFITEKVQDGSRGGEGIYHKLLTQLYFDAHLDSSRLEDEVYIREQNRFITKLLRYLLQENILKVVRMRGEGTSFVIHPDCTMVNSANSMARNAQLVDDDRNLCRSSTANVDGIGNRRSNSVEQTDRTEEPQEGLTQSIYEAHANACANITRLAVPLRPPAVETITPPPRAPSKKRTREGDDIVEIAHSYASTVSDSLSPGANSVRSYKRHGTAEENRRQSAPAHTLRDSSPNKTNSLFHKKYTSMRKECVPLLDFKEEKRKKTLSWGCQVIEELLQTYPHDPVKFVDRGNDAYFECIDCEQLISCGKNRRNKHFIGQHLGSAKHQFKATMAREERREKALPNEFPPLSYLESSKCTSLLDSSNPASCLGISKYAMSTEWYIRPIDIQCFSLPNIPLGEPSGDSEIPQGDEDMALKALQALKTNTDQYQSNMANCMGLIARETLSKSEKLKLLEGRVVAMEKGRQKETEDVLESIASSERKLKVRSDQSDQKLVDSDARFSDKIAKLVEQQKEASTNYETGISFLGVQLRILEAERRTMNEERHRQDRIMDDLESNLQIQSDALSAQQKSQEAMEASLIAQIKKGDVGTAELFHRLEVERLGRMDVLVKASAEEISKLERTLAQSNSAWEKTNERIKFLERKTSQQIEASEIASEDRIRFVEGNMSQIRDTVFQATQKVDDLEQECDKMSSLEKSSADKIRSLEEINDKQNMDYNKMYEIVAAMLHGQNEMERMLPKIIKAVLQENLEEQKAKIQLHKTRRRRIAIGARSSNGGRASRRWRLLSKRRM